MNVLDLFSGIGGFSLGLERAGMSTVAFCEIDPYCRRVLAKHWPDVPCYDDVTTLTAARLAADGIVSHVANTERSGPQQSKGTHAKALLGGCAGTGGRTALGDTPERIQDGGRIVADGKTIDLICGGFPCQDISVAGKQAGITGERSGLWKEYARIIGEVRPRYAIVENVAALLHRGLDVVLGDLAALGYDAEWHCIRAADVGAPHRRDRVWIVVHTTRELLDGSGTAGPGRRGQSANGHSDVADTREPRLPASECEIILGTRRWHEGRAIAERGWWSLEPDVGRVAHGVPARVDRLRALGNAVVPQIPEIIGRAIMSSNR